MRQIPLITLVLALIASSQSANAGLVIDIDNATVAPGQSTSVNVWIASDDPSAAILLQSTAFEFVISPAGSGQLEFANPQSDLELSSSDYVFHNNSFALHAPSPLGVVLGANNVRFVGGDETNDYADVTMTSPKLLARLEITAAATAAPGDYTIALKHSTSSFHDSAFNVHSFTSTPGTVTVTGPVSAVPEPTSLAMITTAVPCVILAYRHQKRGRKPLGS